MNHKTLNKLMNKTLLTLNNVETVKQTLFNISYLIWLLKLDVKTPRMKTHKMTPKMNILKKTLKMNPRMKTLKIDKTLFTYIQRINLNLNCPF